MTDDDEITSPYTIEGTVDLVRRLLRDEPEQWQVYLIRRAEPQTLHQRWHKLAADLWCHSQGHRGIDQPPCYPCTEAVRVVIDEFVRADHAEADFHGWPR